MSELSPIPIERFGKDHWSTFAYAETCWVDEQPLDNHRMRCDPDRHPLNNNVANQFSDTKYATRLKGEGGTGTEELHDHDDWDCLQDLADAGLLTFVSLTNPVIVLTEQGQQVAHQLRKHKAAGGNFHGFMPQLPVATQ